MLTFSNPFTNFVNSLKKQLLTVLSSQKEKISIPRAYVLVELIFTISLFFINQHLLAITASWTKIVMIILTSLAKSRTKSTEMWLKMIILMIIII
jgi:hypothetical protein